MSLFATLAIPTILAGYVVMAVVIIRDTIRKRRDDAADDLADADDVYLAAMCRGALELDEIRTWGPFAAGKPRSEIAGRLGGEPARIEPRDPLDDVQSLHRDCGGKS